VFECAPTERRLADNSQSESRLAIRPTSSRPLVNHPAHYRGGRRTGALTALLLAAAILAVTALPGGAQTPRPSRPARRLPLTPELERTAFADSTARVLLTRARVARLAQDSALIAYDAKTYLRFSIAMGVHNVGPDKLLMRSEQAARVRWGRAAGVWVEPTARRTGVPMGEGDIDLTFATPIPYFPGRESLWIPSSEMGVASAEVNENEFLHPLATGAEAYYRYATGGSVSIRLPDGSSIALRELRITARRPEWRAFVGSFWFDAERGSLVRAAYRMAAELDMWQTVDEDLRQQLAEAMERARTDTGVAAERARREVERLHMGPIDKLKLKAVEGLFSPVRANLSAVTVEYGLYEGRFWLPKLNVAEGELRAGFIRLPLEWRESFNYNSVNSADAVPAAPTPGRGLAADDTMYVVSGELSLGESTNQTLRARADTSAAGRAAVDDSLILVYTRRADSLGSAADRARAAGDSTKAGGLARRSARLGGLARQIARRREACAHDSTYYAGTASRYNGALHMAVRLPCDMSRLADSPDLPGSIYGSGEELFGATERDELMKSLDFGLQPGWGPQWPTMHTGLDLLRYNRIEGLSPGLSATSALGFGYTAQAIGRIGTSDHMPNGELSLTRSNGRADLRAAIFHRLGVANDDWGAPLSFGASLANLLYARDEGFYYRTWGAELTSTHDELGPFGGVAINWRLFGEQQWSAGREPKTQGSLGNVLGNARFEQNIDAIRLTAIGASGDVARTFGADLTGFHLYVRGRAEGALTNRQDSIGVSGYGRFVLDVTASHHVGAFDASFAAAAGASAGDLPAQRWFYVGGLQTVRGQFARPLGPGRAGDAFWLARTEVGPKSLALRPSLFYDVGWAGPRTDFTNPGRPLSGAGVGLALLDGLVRVDAAKGIWPERRWRLDIHLGSRF
jgi:hypothetical protein